MCRVTSPVRFGVERSLLCFHVPEKFGFVGEQIPTRGQKQRREQTQEQSSFHIYRHDSQKSSRSANWISRGVPEPTGVIGFTMAVFKFTVLMMLPNAAGCAGLKVACG